MLTGEPLYGEAAWARKLDVDERIGRSFRLRWTLLRSFSRAAKSREISSELGSESVSKVDCESMGDSGGESEDVDEGEESGSRSSSLGGSMGVSI